MAIRQRKYRSLRWLLRRQLFYQHIGETKNTSRRLFRSFMVTKIEPDQILTEIQFPYGGAALSVPGSTKPPAVVRLRSSPQPRKSSLLVMEPSWGGSSAGGVSPSPLLRGVEAALAGKTPADIEAVCGT